jgi:hypothetical protein
VGWGSLVEVVVYLSMLCSQLFFYYERAERTQTHRKGMGGQLSFPYVEMVLSESHIEHPCEFRDIDYQYFDAIIENTQQYDGEEETNVRAILKLLDEFQPVMLLSARSRSLFAHVMNVIRTTTDDVDSGYQHMRSEIYAKLHWVLPPTYSLGMPCTSETIDDYLLDDPHSLYRKFVPYVLLWHLVDEVDQWTLPMLNSMAVICASAQSSYSGMFSVDEISKNAALFFTELRLTWTQNDANHMAIRRVSECELVPWLPMEEFTDRTHDRDMSDAISANIRNMLHIDARHRTLRCVFPDGTTGLDTVPISNTIDAAARDCLEKLETYVMNAVRTNDFADHGNSLLETWDNLCRWASECADRGENKTEEWRYVLPSTFVYETMENGCRCMANNDLSTEWAKYINKEYTPVPAKMHVCYQEFILKAWNKTPEERAGFTVLERERLENAVYAAKCHLLNTITDGVCLIKTIQDAISDQATVYSRNFVDKMTAMIGGFAGEVAIWL